MEIYTPPQMFPSLTATVAPDPTQFWAAQTRVAPMATNAPWQNFVLTTGTQQEYLHPYSFQSSQGKLSVCYPKRVDQIVFVIQVIISDLVFGCLEEGNAPHSVIAHDDLSVTLSYGTGRLVVPIVRGSPYITLVYKDGTPVISTSHAILSVESNADNTKHKVTLNNEQTWLIYASSPLPVDNNLGVNNNGQRFTGTVRIAALPTTGNTTGSNEWYLDQYSSGAYPVGGEADFSAPFQAKFNWKKEGTGDLLILSLPHQRENDVTLSAVQTIPSLAYDSIDGSLQGVVGDSWTITTAPISVSWHSKSGLAKPEYRDAIVAALEADVANLTTIENNSTYFYGKALARAARMALIAEELGGLDAQVEAVRVFLVNTISPWFEGTIIGNALVYDTKWGGIVSRQGSVDMGADFGLAVYNDHHYHFGYFAYAGAVLAKLDNAWGQKYKSYLYALVTDYLNPSATSSLSPRLRHFDSYVLHSWAAGLTDFVDGRNQESTTEAINGYYAASLLGLAYGDTALTQLGLTLTAFEINAAQALWHVPSQSTLYDPLFVSENRIVGILWPNKRDSGLWFGLPIERELRLGIQVLPLTPITEVVFNDVTYTQQLVEWALPRMDAATEQWRGFTYALMYLYNPQAATDLINKLSVFDDGNSKSNMLWWIYTRV